MGRGNGHGGFALNGDPAFETQPMVSAEQPKVSPLTTVTSPSTSSDGSEFLRRALVETGILGVYYGIHHLCKSSFPLIAYVSSSRECHMIVSMSQRQSVTVSVTS